jgi:hypothetical protein
MQDHAADELHVEGAQPKHPFRRLADRRKGRHQKIVEIGALSDLLAEFVGAGPERLVAERGELGLKRVDLWADGS